MKDLVVKMDDSEQGVTRENGVIYVMPRPGTIGNTKIDIYAKDPKKGLVLLQSRHFRVERLPDPSTFTTKLTSGE
jgi:hypothetical protein